MRLFLFPLLITIASAAVAQSTVITYQGTLSDSGIAANGDYDFEFQLWDDLNGGSQVGSTIVFDNRVVVDGVFSVPLDFGSGAFSGNDRWLLIRVREGSSVAGFTDLLPRQLLTPAPYALHAQSVAMDAIGTSQIQAGAVGSNELAENSVGESEVASNAVGGDELIDGSVGQNDLATNSVGAVQVQSGAVSGNAGGGPSHIAPGTIDSIDVDSGSIQSRITGQCGLSAVSQVLEDGQVVCSSIPSLPVGFSVTGIASTISGVEYGIQTSIAIGSDGRPVVTAAADIGVPNIAFYRCGDSGCQSPGASFLFSDGTTTAVATGQSGNPVIAAVFNAALDLYSCSDLACTQSTVHTVTSDSAQSLGGLAIRADGRPIIAYQGTGPAIGQLLVASCDDVVCSSVTQVSPEMGGFAASIAMRQDGTPIVSHITGAGLSLVSCNDQNCSTSVPYPSDPTGMAGSNTSIAVRDNGEPIISYFDSSGNDLLVYFCTAIDCSNGITVTLDGADDVGEFSSIVVRQDGLPIISYYDRTHGDLKVYDCTQKSCTQGIARSLDVDGDVGLNTAIAINAQGLPVISYFDATGGDLKLFQCGDPRCQNY